MKLTKLLLLTGAAISLAACDFPFGPGGGDDGEIDVNLHHLKLSYSSNVNFAQEDLVVKFAYGERHDITTRPQDEIDEFLSAGAKQEDINKSGVRQEDGSYFFFDQDPIIITAPALKDAIGFRFLGFFEKGTNTKIYEPVDGKNKLDDGTEVMLINRWNMADKDIELEARYETLKYDVTYIGNEGLIANPTNPTKYDASEKLNVELVAPASIPEGYTFGRWFCKEEHATPVDPDARATLETITSLPNYFDPKIFDTTNPSGLKFQAEAEFEPITREIHFEFNLYVDPDNIIAKDWSDVCEKIDVKGNLLKVDGVYTDAAITEVNKNSKIELAMTSWFEVFVNAKEGFTLSKYSVDGGDTYTIVSETEGRKYFSFDKGFEKDTTVLLQFILAD